MSGLMRWRSLVEKMGRGGKNSIVDSGDIAMTARGPQGRADERF
jgi:hypothetical protein